MGNSVQDVIDKKYNEMNEEKTETEIIIEALITENFVNPSKEDADKLSAGIKKAIENGELTAEEANQLVDVTINKIRNGSEEAKTK